MAEYIDREEYCKKHCRCSNEYCDKERCPIWKAPTVDAEVVVRCKDCKHSTLPSMHTQIYGKPGTLTCHNRKSPCNNRNVASDYYCKQGERNTET